MAEEMSSQLSEQLVEENKWLRCSLGSAEMGQLLMRIETVGALEAHDREHVRVEPHGLHRQELVEQLRGVLGRHRPAAAAALVREPSAEWVPRNSDGSNGWVGRSARTPIDTCADPYYRRWEWAPYAGPRCGLGCPHLHLQCGPEARTVPHRAPPVRRNAHTFTAGGLHYSTLNSTHTLAVRPFRPHYRH